MLRDLLRFQRDGRRLLERPDEKVTLGDFASGRGYSEDFVERYLIPMGAAIWSAQPERMRDFPAYSLMRFFENHGLLERSGQPRWRVVRGGSQRYVDALVAPFRDRIHLNAPVRRVLRNRRAVELHVGNAGVGEFDQVVIATHSDQALALLADPSDAERHVLSAIRYQPNEVVLHTDTSVLPRRRRAWASWNYRIPQRENERVLVTYHMNRLQSLDAPVDFCVTLNDTRSVDPRHRIGRWTYHHPIFDRDALEAQAHRPLISGVNRTWYCGAYWGYGFHEDGVRSGSEVARALVGGGEA
jgi:predicted NAD/FAD-binding protein